MTHTQYDAFAGWLEQQAVLCSRSSASLAADHRIDEANFQKIRGNIFDIFRTILRVADQTCADDHERFHLFYLQRLDQLPAAWTSAREKALAHSDAHRAHLEQIKLDAAQEIRREYLRIREDAR